jgi:hypothetical protein
MTDGQQESSDKAIHIEDFNIDVVEAMVYFMYHFDYKTTEDSSALILNTKVYQIADKYGIGSLKELAASKFRDATKTFWRSDEFPMAVTLTYTTTLPTDMGLRKSILVTTFDNFDDIMGLNEFCETLKTNQDFATDLVRFMFEKKRGIHEYRCSSCGRYFHFGSMNHRLKYCPLCKSVPGDWSTVPDA